MRATLLLAMLAALAAASIVAGLVGTGGWDPVPGGPGAAATSEEPGRPQGTAAGDGRAVRGHRADDAPAIRRRAAAEEGARPVRLRCRCATIDAERLPEVWGFLGLVVRIEEPDGRLLAAVDRPHEFFEVRVPRRVAELVLRAEGYRPRALRLPADARDPVDLGTATLEPDARVAVEVRSLPAATRRLLVTARFQERHHRATGPWLWPGARTVISAHQGHARLELPVPSGLLARVSIRTDGGPEAVGFPALWSDRFELAPGEERVLVFDLADGSGLWGRLTGLPAVALSGQAIDLRAAGSAGGLVVSATDARGRFAFVDLPAQECRLSVAGIPLRASGSGIAAWNPEHARDLVVEPAVPTVGVLFVAGDAPVAAPVAVDFRAPPRPGDARRRVPLFALDALRQRARLHAYVEGIGHFTCALAEVRPDPDGLVRCEVPPRTGSILVRAGDPPGELRLLARPATGDLDPAVWTSGIRAAELDDGWLLDGLQPGAHELQWEWRKARGTLRRAFPDPVVVRAGQRTELVVPVPRPTVVRGEVTNWHLVPADVRPELVFVSGSRLLRGANVAPDGTFGAELLGAPDRVDALTFAGGRSGPEVSTRDLVYDPHAPSLRVRFPVERCGGRLRVEPVLGGRVSVGFASPTMRRIVPGFSWFAGRWARPGVDGRISLMEHGGPVEGMVLEVVGGSTHVRGWFRLPTARGDRELSPSGRWIEVDARAMLERYPRLAPVLTLRMAGPTWWQHGEMPVPVAVDRDATGRFWLPGDATGVGFRADPAEIPAGRIRDRLALDAEGRPVF